jgi:hypothetical protein
MKAEIGYITAWRRAIFFSLVIDIILFGTVSTIASTFIGGIAANMLSVCALLLCGVITLLVVADKWERYSDIGMAVIDDGRLIYNDKKRHINVKLSDIKKVDMEKISIKYDGPPTAYRILIKTNRKKYYIESDRANGRDFKDMGINELYLYINQALNDAKK